VTIGFSDQIVRLGRFVATRNGDGDLVKSARISPRDATRVVVSLKRPGPKKQNGTYRVIWRVTGVDGHTVNGVVAFRVKQP
jgi:methionine-rich copper-binding protein CopC